MRSVGAVNALGVGGVSRNLRKHMRSLCNGLRDVSWCKPEVLLTCTSVGVGACWVFASPVGP